MSDPDRPSSLDRFLNGRISLRQPAQGHRVGTDAVLLSAATPPRQSGLILDAGAGVGAVGLMAAQRAPSARIGLVEIEPATAQFARENVRLNALDGRALVYETDLLSASARRAAGLSPDAASVVLTNPPFHAAGRVRVTPDPSKALAHVAAAPLEAWIRACLALLAPGGLLVMIHRADALAECLAAVERRLGGVSILPVLPHADRDATRILLAGKKGSRAPLRLRAPLTLHSPKGGFTPEAEAICRGEAGLPLADD